MSTRKDETNANEPGKRTGVLTRIVIVVAIVGALFYFFGYGNNANEDMARAQCELYVEEFLKAPSTATHSYDPVITEITDTSWAIKSFTDSENSFGAEVRTNWICDASYDEDADLWHLQLRETF